MKKIVSLLIGILCVMSASAVTYGNPYTGAGRNGYVASSASYHSTSLGFAQTPTAAMRSTSAAYGVAYTGTTQAMSGVTMQVQGMYTAATGVRGGVTTYDSYSGPRRSGEMPPKPTDCGSCNWVWDEEEGDYVCINCGCTSLDGCECHSDPEGPGYCWCPIGDGWDVWIMLAVMAISYVLFMRRRNEKMQNNLHN